MKSNVILPWYGQSLLFNTLAIVLNITGITFVTMGFHKNWEELQTLFLVCGFSLLVVSALILFFLKGKIFMANVSRVLVGGLFIVSGLIKANDPLGFSYKLEEYFEDGALAYRIKEWFSSPGFSLEFLIDYALILSVVVCVLEIVLGVLVLLGGKIKLVSWLLLVTMLFFTFLTWHTANCDGNTKFLDRDYYSQQDPIGKMKIEESKSNPDVKVHTISKEEIVIDELKQPQCVSDCGCFGDAMKGSVGRSLTPQESLWKDYILLYLVLWIFISQRQIAPNTFIENLYLIPFSLLVIAFFCFVFGWYFPLLFGFTAIFVALWGANSRIKRLNNYWFSSLLVILMSLLFTFYVLSYEPLKDYRPYAEGSNLKEKMNDGKEGKYLNLLVYKNLKNGEKIEYDGSSSAYINSKIWEKTDLWKYDTMVTKEIIPTRLPSISTQFDPIVYLQDISKDELNLPFIQNRLKQRYIQGYKVKDKETGEEILVSEIEFQDAYSDTSFYSFIGREQLENPDLSEISIRNYLIEAPLVYILFSKDLNTISTSKIDKIRGLVEEVKGHKIPFVFITSSSREDINKFKNKYKLHLPTFINDATELKAISRSNPSLMILKKGVVIGKFPNRSIPSYKWIKNHIYNK